jgi:glycosyltransferase involved in cell wall biosynthesis
MSLPKISVITVSYNQGEFIKQNIESVLAQNYPNFEHLIIDGGSTDSTLSVLKEFPHLKWTSEPDRGQSDALNKGFARASGDIIAWLNSDDWYAPNIFFDIAQALDDYPVVLGVAEQTDRNGKTTETIQNTARSFYDLWRYWIPYAWVAQPSIFFRKSLLEQVRRYDGTYVDEDLFFTMDSDLWMRIAAQYPFSKRISKTLSYFRIYGENKTGARPLATQRECSRVFRRHASKGAPVEQEISFIIPVSLPNEDLKKTVISLVNQVHVNFDIVIADRADDKKASKQVHEFSLDLSETINHITTRYIKSPLTHDLSAYNTGVEKATSSLVSFLMPGDVVSKEFSLQISNIFSRDVIGLLLPDIGIPEITQNLYKDPNLIDPTGVLTMPFFLPGIVARRLACLELGTFGTLNNPIIAIKEFILRIIFHGWAVHCANDIKLEQKKTDLNKAQQYLNLHLLPLSAYILLRLQEDLAKDPFSSIRAQIRDPNSVFRILPQHPDQILALMATDWKDFSL